MDRRKFVAGLFGTAAVGGAAAAAGVTTELASAKLSADDFGPSCGMMASALPMALPQSVDEMLLAWYGTEFGTLDNSSWLLNSTLGRAVWEECERLRPGHVWPAEADVRKALLAAPGTAKVVSENAPLFFDVYDTVSRPVWDNEPLPAFPFSLAVAVRKLTAKLIEAHPTCTRPVVETSIVDGWLFVKLTAIVHTFQVAPC